MENQKKNLYGKLIFCLICGIRDGIPFCGYWKLRLLWRPWNALNIEHVGTRGHWNRSMVQNILCLCLCRGTGQLVLAIMKAVIGMITVLYPLKCLEKSVEISKIFDNVNPIIYRVKYTINHTYFIAMNIYK